MCSIRSQSHHRSPCAPHNLRNIVAGLCLMAGAAIFSGCVSATQAPSEPAGVTPRGIEPMAADPAMEYRIWDRSAVVYANGGVVAGATGFPYRIQDEAPDAAHLLLDPALFVGQTFALPVSLLLSKSSVTYNGAAVPTTYDAVPPVEGDTFGK